MKSKRIILIIIIALSMVNNIEAQNIFTKAGTVIYYGGGSFGRSLILNQNVYKTKMPLGLTKVYHIEADTVIQTDTTHYKLTPDTSYKYLRYKVVKDDAKSPYIVILPKICFSEKIKGQGKNKNDSIVEILGTDSTILKNNPNNYYFQIKDDLVPNNHYLASQTLVGMPIVMPLKLRKLDSRIKMEPDITLGYAFGYKIRVNNNPYKERYLNIIPLALSVNKDNYMYKISDGNYSKDVPAVSFTYYSWGLAYEWNGYNIGAFMGWDTMFNWQANWPYQKKTWYSLGVGYKLGK